MPDKPSHELQVKSTILRALRTVVHFASGSFRKVGEEWALPFNPHLDDLTHFEARASFDDQLSHKLLASGSRVVESLVEVGEETKPFERAPSAPPGLLSSKKPYARSMLSRLSGARLIRFDPDALRQPSELIPDGQSPFLRDDRGTGLPLGKMFVG